jgi:serine/threonine protein phosphatase PrpC
MKLDFAGNTDKGIVRSVNQDAFHVDPKGRFFIVADGMGGHAGGEVASRIAADTIQAYLDKNWDNPLESSVLLENAFWEANEAILRDQMAHKERSDMGTTAVVLIFRDPEKPYCANIGDSRLYRLRDDNLTQVTEDQTWVAQAVKRKALTLEQARVHPWRHVLSQCLGREDLQEIDIMQLDVKLGDRFLLCSDGLTEELSEPLICSPLLSIENCDMATTALINAAKLKGGRDNITVVLINVDG